MLQVLTLRVKNQANVQEETPLYAALAKLGVPLRTIPSSRGDVQEVRIKSLPVSRTFPSIRDGSRTRSSPKSLITCRRDVPSLLLHGREYSPGSRSADFLMALQRKGSGSHHDQDRISERQGQGDPHSRGAIRSDSRPRNRKSVSFGIRSRGLSKTTMSLLLRCAWDRRLQTS